VDLIFYQLEIFDRASIDDGLRTSLLSDFEIPVAIGASREFLPIHLLFFLRFLSWMALQISLTSFFCYRVNERADIGFNHFLRALSICFGVILKVMIVCLKQKTPGMLSCAGECFRETSLEEGFPL